MALISGAEFSDMSIEIHKAVEPNYLRLAVSGEYSFERLFPFIDQIKDEATASGQRSVLVDCTQLAGNMTEAERFEGGKRIAEVLGPGIRLAVVMPEGGVTKLGEIVARNRGAQLLVTESIVEAEDWLVPS